MSEPDLDNAELTAVRFILHREFCSKCVAPKSEISDSRFRQTFIDLARESNPTEWDFGPAFYVVLCRTGGELLRRAYARGN